MDVFFLPHHHTSCIQKQEGVPRGTRSFHMHHLAVLEMSLSFAAGEGVVVVEQFYHHHIHRAWCQHGSIQVAEYLNRAFASACYWAVSPREIDSWLGSEGKKDKLKRKASFEVA